LRDFHRKNDELVKSQKTPFSVIPAEAGIQEYQELLDPGACPGPDPGFAGVTAWKTFYETSKYQKKGCGLWVKGSELKF
jgi:hypothetical protein